MEEVMAYGVTHCGGQTGIISVLNRKAPVLVRTYDDSGNEH